MERTPDCTDMAALADALKAIAAIGAQGGLAPEATASAVERCLALAERAGTSTSTAPPSPPAVATLISEHADALHAKLVTELAAEYPPGLEIGREPLRAFLLRRLTQLRERGALTESDVPQLERVVDIVLDEHNADTLAYMVQAQAALATAYRTLRLNPDASTTARTVAGIAADSAGRAVAQVAAEEAGTAPAAADAQSAKQRRQNFWATVKDDVNGAVGGAGLLVGLAAVGTLGLALPPIMTLGALGALGTASLVSGIELARLRR